MTNAPGRRAGPPETDLHTDLIRLRRAMQELRSILTELEAGCVANPHLRAAALGKLELDIQYLRALLSAYRPEHPGMSGLMTDLVDPEVPRA